MIRGGALAVAMTMAVFGVAAGCSNDEGGSTGPRVSCIEACAHCTLTTICQDCDGFAMRFRDEFENVLYACVPEMDACANDWQACATRAIDAMPPRDIDPAFRSACLAKRTECQNQGMGFADDDCLLSAAFITEVVNEAQQCLPKPCSEVAACFVAAFR
jgi:hypothetical protein